MIYYNNLEFDEEVKFEIYIMKQFLTKHYGSKKAMTLLEENISDIDDLAFALGKIDIAFFCLYFLQELFVPSSENKSRPLDKVHYDVLEELNNMFIKDLYENGEFILPRGCAKSTIINTSISCWASCYKISQYTVVIGKTDKLVEEFVAEVRTCLNFKKIKEIFGDLINTRTRIVNKQELELDNDCKIQGFTWGGTIRGSKYKGSRPSIIITDDVLKEDDILSDQSKEKCVNKYYKEVLPAGDEAREVNGKIEGINTKFIVIGTPLATDCFINTIKNDSSFTVFHRSVCNLDVDKYFTENTYWQRYKEILFNSRNESRIQDAKDYYYENIEKMKFPTLWEGKYKCYKLANDYFTKRLAFMQELMCDCDSVGDIWIKYQAKMKAQELENRKFDRTVLSIDQGASNTVKSDFYAMTILGRSNGFYLVREGSLYKFDSKTEFDKYIDTVIFLLKTWKDVTHVFLEKNVYKGVDATRIEEKIRDDKELSSRRIKVQTTYSTTNKDQRISTITDKINSGQIIFNEANVDYNNQVKTWRGQKFTPHDDAIDSLEMSVNNIDKIKTGQGKLTVIQMR